MECPQCDYESSEQGVKIHFGRSHEGTIGGSLVECAYCGDEFRAEPNKVEKNKNMFCSSDHHDKWRAENVSGEDAGGWRGGKVEFTCFHCGETAEKWESRVEKQDRSFCTPDCYSEWQEEAGVRSGEDNGMFGVTGEDHPGWRGGVDDFRLSKRWHSLRQEIWERDDYTCLQCGNGGCKVHAHHIWPVSEGGPKWDKRNLATVCEDCHWEIHSN